MAYDPVLLARGVRVQLGAVPRMSGAGSLRTRGREMSEWRDVSREEFYAVVGPLSVHPSPERDRTVWRHTHSLAVVGISTPGYLCEGAQTYRLLEKSRT